MVQEDIELAKAKAQTINQHNLKRRELDQSITEEALQMIVTGQRVRLFFILTGIKVW